MTPREHLVEALAAAVQSSLEEHPDLDVTDACVALGMAAGAVIVAEIPPGMHEADIEVATLLGRACGEAVIAARRGRAS